MSVGWPQSAILKMWARAVSELFGEMVYQVGSSVDSKDWRDVDVVVMLPKAKFDHWIGPQDMMGVRWQYLCTAISCWGKEITGLPIDFKIQEVEWANENRKGHRDAIGISIDPDWVHLDYGGPFEAPEWMDGVEGGEE